MINLEEVFERLSEDEFLKFDRIQNKLHPRPDVCAFLFLDKLVPPVEGIDMVSGSKHDEIWLDVNCDKLSMVATEEDIVTLVRCGVRYDSEYHSLAMFT